MKLHIPILFSAVLASGTAMTQNPTGARVDIEAVRGPVTVVSVQPPLANAADYSDTVARLDSNGDGVVTRQEVPFNHALAFEFALVDTDRNGRITQAELSNWK